MGARRNLAAAVVVILLVGFVSGVVAGLRGEGWSPAAEGFAMLAMAHAGWTYDVWSLRRAGGRRRSRSISLVLLVLSLIGLAGAFLAGAGFLARIGLLLISVAALGSAVAVTIDLGRRNMS